MRIERIEGTALPIRGDNIDTDRIIPARFLKAVTFEGLERHVFEDDRQALVARGEAHSFDNPAYQDASVLITSANFGCGSSREHAPQALRRWGIQACVGESFSEIFLGNALMMGMPCVTAPRQTISHLMDRVERSPGDRFVLDLSALTLAAGRETLMVSLQPAMRESFLTGAWDATGLLLDAYDEVRAVAARLPYVRGF